MCRGEYWKWSEATESRKKSTVKSYIIYIPQLRPVIELSHQENKTERAST